jgi:hypothetical protein
MSRQGNKIRDPPGFSDAMFCGWVVILVDGPYIAG